jgi:hypothetical protein
MAYVAKRRRGPNKPKAQTITSAGPDGDSVTITVAPLDPGIEYKVNDPTQPARRRKRADVGGQHLKLAMPQREGFQRRWVNDTPGRIAMFQELAYDHVSETGIKSDSPDSRVRRLVGTQAGGAPQYAYLMETPDSEYRAGIEEKEEGRRPFEEAIRRGEDTLGQGITSKAVTAQSSIR